MDPFVALMRRYVVDYTNRHDTAVCAEIMDENYTLRMGPHVLQGREEHYIPAARIQFEQYPGLGLTVHDVVTNGDHLAMSFSEHGAATARGGARASWSGIGIYRWDGRRLLENFVEQDYLSRRRQLDSGEPHRVDSPAVAPWDCARQDGHPEIEGIVRAWIGEGLTGDETVANDGTPGPRMRDGHSDLDLIFSAGDRVAFRARVHGSYDGGLDEVPETAHGKDTTLYVVGLATVDGTQVTVDRLVTDRLGVVRSLR